MTLSASQAQTLISNKDSVKSIWLRILAPSPLFFKKIQFVALILAVLGTLGSNITALGFTHSAIALFILHIMAYCGAAGAVIPVLCVDWQQLAQQTATGDGG